MSEQLEEDYRPELTVGKLREFMASMHDAMPIRVHVGWDWPVSEWDADEFLVLFADIPDRVSFVNKAGLDSMEDSHTEVVHENQRLRKMLNEAVDAHIKISAAYKVGTSRTPEKALDTMQAIRTELGK